MGRKGNDRAPTDAGIQLSAQWKDMDTNMDMNRDMGMVGAVAMAMAVGMGSDMGMGIALPELALTHFGRQMHIHLLRLWRYLYPISNV